MLNYIKSHPFLKHVLYIIIVTILLLWIVSLMIRSYTGFNQAVVVPDFSGKSVRELDSFSSEHNLRFEIIDSVFNTDKKKGTVISQIPLPETRVKKNRIIYLTIVTSLPERIAMPNFKDLSLRQAKSMIETYGLKMGSFNYIASEYKDAVLEQLYQNHPIKPGTPINKGSVIDLVVGDGLKKEKIAVPFLYGKTPSEVAEALKSISLNLGATIYIDGDSTHSRVIKQKPDCKYGNLMYVGESIDIWFRSEKNYDFGPLLEKIKQDTSKK